MRKLLCILALLLVTAAVGSPLTAHAGPLPAGHAPVAQAAASGTALFCLLPACDGPLCFPRHGCPYCCNG